MDEGGQKPDLDLELALGHIVRAIRPDLVVGIRGRAAAEPPFHHLRAQSTAADHKAKRSNPTKTLGTTVPPLRFRKDPPTTDWPSNVDPKKRPKQPEPSGMARDGAEPEPIPPRTSLPSCPPPGSRDRRRRRGG